MSKGISLHTHKEFEKAYNDDKYILILKHPYNKSRIHKKKCAPLASRHQIDANVNDYRIVSGSQYFAFDNLEDAKKEYPTYPDITNARCKLCSKND